MPPCGVDPETFPFKPLSPMVLHVVGLKFLPTMSEEDIRIHFETEASAQARPTTA